MWAIIFFIAFSYFLNQVFFIARGGSVAAHPPFEVIHQTKVKIYVDNLKIWDFELDETEARDIYEKGRKLLFLNS